MFFARLAVAALSLGTVASVFAAPVGISGAEASVVFSPSDVQRRALLAFPDAVDEAFYTILSLKDNMSKLAEATDTVTPDIIATVSTVGAAVGPVLEAAKENILTKADGTHIDSVAVVEDVNKMFAAIDKVIVCIQGLESVDLAKSALVDLQAKVDATKNFIKGVLPGPKLLKDPMALNFLVTKIAVDAA
ncbi:hypothetical protein RhiLY_01744 [Ceratobasidium sp. AG-Ba]|nr:hypothetical protein RhiLY_01744 [Ceratobasidium sp. AG-Ba]